MMGAGLASPVVSITMRSKSPRRSDCDGFHGRGGVRRCRTDAGTRTDSASSREMRRSAAQPQHSQAVAAFRGRQGRALGGPRRARGAALELGSHNEAESERFLDRARQEHGPPPTTRFSPHQFVEHLHQIVPHGAAQAAIVQHHDLLLPVGQLFTHADQVTVNVHLAKLRGVCGGGSWGEGGYGTKSSETRWGGVRLPIRVRQLASPTSRQLFAPPLV